MCDKRLGGKITNNEVLCEHYLCSSLIIGISTSQYLLKMSQCDIDCGNTDLNKEGCSDDLNDEKIALPTGWLVPPSEICNDVCDMHNCEDEAICNGYRYGKYCMPKGAKKLEYVSPEFLCDGNQSCEGGDDEEDCAVTSDTETFCKHALTGEIVPVHNYTRCTSVHKSDYEFVSGQVYCEIDEISSYQTNCSDPLKVALSCEINGYTSTVSKHLICFDDMISACDDHIDSSCYSTKSCKVHKHLLCDQKMDCNDNADEAHSSCLATTKGTVCKRRVGIESELPIPISWLRDGIRDCTEDGIDETADWPKCGVGKSSRFVSSTERDCSNVFICKSGSPGYELLENLCDGIENCGNENAVCSISSRSQSVATTVSTTNKGLTKTLSFCRKGLARLKLFLGACVTEEFIYPTGDIFGGQTTSVVLPNSTQSCDYMYGEQYLYTSCTDHCFKASCPLRNIPRYEVCPDQIPDRIGTIVNNEYLIFLTKSFGNVYTNTFLFALTKKYA